MYAPHRAGEAATSVQSRCFAHRMSPAPPPPDTSAWPELRKLPWQPYLWLAAAINQACSISALSRLSPCSPPAMGGISSLLALSGARQPEALTLALLRPVCLCCMFCTTNDSLVLAPLDAASLPKGKDRDQGVRGSACTASSRNERSKSVTTIWHSNAGARVCTVDKEGCGE